MRIRCGLSALLLALTPTACDNPVPPPVAQRPTALDADDFAVMKGVLDDVRERRVGRQFMVIDTTIAICDRPNEVSSPPPGGCLAPRAVDFVSKALPPASRLTALVDFQARNAGRRPITATLGADVTFISATLNDFMTMTDLLREHPGSALVTFSAPSYPAPRVAVMVYRVRDAENAVVQLQQQADGRWAVAARYGGME